MDARLGKTIVLACLAIGLAVGSAAVADNLYFTQDTGDNDTLMMVTGLTRGAIGGGLGSEPGFKAAGTGSDGIGAIDAAMIGGQPRVATGGQIIHFWDGNDIAYLKHSDPTGPGDNNPVRELVLGEVGGNEDRLVIARETGTGATNILVQMFEASTMNHITTPGPHNNIGNAVGMARGNFTDSAPGSEIVIGTTDLATLNKSPGFQLYVRGDNLGWLGQQPVQVMTDVAAGDLVPGVNNDEAIFTGNIGGDPGPGNGQQSHVFSTGPGFSMDYQWNNAGGGPHGPSASGGLTFNAVAVGQLDADAEPEIVLVGDNVVRVLNHDGSFVFQSGPSGQNLVDVVIADAMDNDGVNEIIAVSEGGAVLAYGHSVVGDASSAFAGGVLGYYSGGSAPFTGIAALNTNVIPEPASLVLLLLAACGLAVARRR